MVASIRQISAERRRPHTLWVAAGRATATNERLVAALDACGVRALRIDPARLGRVVRSADAVLGRLDVRPTLDGVEDGIWALRRVERRGLRVLNPAHSLIACHDKLRTFRALEVAGLPQPRTLHVERDRPRPRMNGPVVVKPRFGSWGRDVELCGSDAELGGWLSRFASHARFQRHGAIVQELVPPLGVDLRIVFVGGRVVGAVERVAAPGEWRTNVALGGSRRPASPPQNACALAIAAAAAVGGDLVGVDLLPLTTGDYVVLEVNGAVDFTATYSRVGEDVFAQAAAALAWELEGVEDQVAELGV
jgi:RimK family alpha-L-glutamate ligase